MIHHGHVWCPVKFTSQVFRSEHPRSSQMQLKRIAGLELGVSEPKTNTYPIEISHLGGHKAALCFSFINSMTSNRHKLQHYQIATWIICEVKYFISEIDNNLWLFNPAFCFQPNKIENFIGFQLRIMHCSTEGRG